MADDASLSGRAYLKLVLLGVAIGIPAALIAAVFLAAVHELEDALWPDDAQWYRVVGLPVAGAAVVLAARKLLPGDGGHDPLAGIGGGVTPLSHAPGIALAALGTLAFGAVLGPEAPLIALGSVAGVAAAKLARLGPKETQVLAMAGSFSAISALFGGPLVAGMLMVEGAVGLGTKAVPALLPGLVAAAIGYVLFVGLGDWGGLNTTALAFPGLPEYDGTYVIDLVVAVVVGIVTAILVGVIREAAARVQAQQRARLPATLLAGGLAVGLLAQLTEVLGGDWEETLFSGQSAVPELVAEGSVSIVLLVLATKAIAYAICLGCGFRGGPVFPAIFLGVGVATLPVIWFDMSPTVAVAIGTAAGMAAGTRLLFASVLFAGLLVGTSGLDAIPAAVLAGAAAWLTMAARDR
ncbi:MAG TPA: chloride channel protein [Solirubrobacter sp.]|nr:chloride channel protein [Solirubrobacter sp.]